MPNSELPRTLAPSLAQRLLAEGVRPLREAAQEAGLDPPPATKSMLRWSISGKHGHVLETIRVAGRVVTSPQAVVRFIEATQPSNPIAVQSIDRVASERILKTHRL